MCNLYSLTKGQQAILEFTRAMVDRTGNLPPMPGIFPDYAAPIVRNSTEGRELTLARWGMNAVPGSVFGASVSDPPTSVISILYSLIWVNYARDFTANLRPDPFIGLVTDATHFEPREGDLIGESQRRATEGRGLTSQRESPPAPLRAGGLGNSQAARSGVFDLGFEAGSSDRFTNLRPSARKRLNARRNSISSRPAHPCVVRASRSRCRPAAVRRPVDLPPCSRRHYLMPDDGVIKRLSRRVVDGLVAGDESLPEYASSRQRVACVVVRNEERKPAAILDVQGVYWIFDADGGIDLLEQQKVAGEAMNLAFSVLPETKGRIVSLAPALRKRAFEAKHRWEPTKSELDRISADLWPDANGPVESVQAVKSKTPVKPPLTYEGERALTEIDTALSKIAFVLDGLSEKALKGLAFEARRNANNEDEGPLWRGVAEEADRQREIAARRRTGKGYWYAIVEGWADDPTNRHVSQHLEIAHELCDSRDAAVGAARRLLAANVHRFTAEVRIEACVKSELEWKPLDD